MNSSFKTLLSLFQKLDFRDKKNSGKKKLAGILTAYMFSNSILAFNYSQFFDEKSFIILTLTSNLFLISMIVLNDFDNLFLGTKSFEVLNLLPVNNSDLFFSKFISALVYLMFFMFAASLPQVIFFYFIEKIILKTILYFLANIIFCFFFTGVIVLLYMFVLNYFTRKAGLLLNIIQIIFFIFIFYSSSLSSKVVNGSTKIIEKLNILDYDFVKFFPQTFFAEAVYSSSKLLICIAIVFIIFYSLYKYMSKNYFLLMKKTGLLTKKEKSNKKLFDVGFFKNFINNNLLSNNYERASYNLVKNQLKNSRFLIAKYIPMAIVPLLMVVVGLVSDIPGFLFSDFSSSQSLILKTSIIILGPSVLFTLMMSSRMLISNTKILDENTYSTEWIYDSLPLKEKYSVIKGANKYIYINFIFPVIFIILALISFKAEFGSALLNVVYIASGIYFINSVTSLFDKTFPFTLESSKFNSASKFLEILIAMILSAVLFLIQIFVFQNIIFALATIFIFIIISYLINRN